jgi:uncharacterized protein (TIGR02588 family)
MARRSSALPGTHTPGLEWAAAAVGGAILAAMIGYMLWTALARPEEPPELSVRIEAVRPAGESYLVEFIARNDGQTTAAAVLVSGELTPGRAGAVERSEAQLDFVPKRSERRGGLIFGSDPARGTLALRVEGFSYP